MGGDSMVPLASQVGGHPGILTSKDGSQLYKPALGREVNFYRSLKSDPVFVSLAPYIPEFCGVLRSQGVLEDGNLEIARGAPKEDKDKYLHLERHRKSPAYLPQQYI